MLPEEIVASANCAIPETFILLTGVAGRPGERALSSFRPPSPPSAGAETTPTVMTPSTSRPIRVAQTGMPRTKLTVPSIGSSTQRRGCRRRSPFPRPRTASPGPFLRSAVARMAASAARSASLTGVCPASSQRLRRVGGKH